MSDPPPPPHFFGFSSSTPPRWDIINLLVNEIEHPGAQRPYKWNEDKHGPAPVFDTPRVPEPDLSGDTHDVVNGRVFLKRDPADTENIATNLPDPVRELYGPTVLEPKGLAKKKTSKSSHIKCMPGDVEAFLGIEVANVEDQCSTDLVLQHIEEERTEGGKGTALAAGSDAMETHLRPLRPPRQRPRDSAVLEDPPTSPKKPGDKPKEREVPRPTEEGDMVPEPA